MNDVKRLLAAALNEESFPMTQTVDPQEDVARGQRHLHRRRTAIASGVAAAALLVGGGATWLANTPGDEEGRTRVANTVVRDSAPAAAPVDQKVTLVAYTGEQPKGYRVERVPDGWVIQGGSESSLAIAPKGAKDKDPNSFVDKLTVLSASSDTPPEGLRDGTPVPTGDRTGYYRVAEDGVAIFTYQDASGRWVQIQVPGLLHWDAARVAEFATGVTVVNGAGDSHG